VNNAGTTGKGGFTADYDVEDWHRTITLNLDSVFYCLRAEIPVMLAQGGGAIVNVASGAGLVGFAGLPAYVASKHGVVGLTRASALEYAAHGIRVNCVCPGSTRTPMLEGFMGGDEKIEKMMRNAVPLRRLGRPEEIAAAIVWLCSDAASFVVGHALAVDGGSVIQ
jgi:NAD(P)-dependent dehydrogenase (short-subunit alcohol dehydrogenase family)